MSSYRIANGVLHNPASDRRTTAGVFHIADGGLPVPDDKKAVPAAVFGRLVEHAVHPPAESMTLPFTADEADPAACFVSLLLRPVVVPEVPGYARERRMEIRFIVPGGLVSNLDFVESIFGNGGDPFLPENDAALDPGTWTGTTGCVILAPHLTRLTKKELGLPHVDEATERQKRDGMCWSSPQEKYNDGGAFKICARDERGVIVTLIADSYFGYCKKEVKTQIGYSANLYGGVEEEHAGGALVFPSYDLGREFTDVYTEPGQTIEEVLARDPDRFEVQPEGHAFDREHEELVLVPERSTYRLREQSVTWEGPGGETRRIPLRADRIYIGPGGYRVRLHQDPEHPKEWNLVGTSSRATSCHKPSTVSGGGKSEISKAISDAFVSGTSYTADLPADLDAVEEILRRDYADRFADEDRNGSDHRSVLSPDRSAGSVIKLLTQRAEYSEEYNAWLDTIPQHVKELVYVVKDSYRPEWGEDWRSHFSVGIINGRSGNQVRLDDRKIRIHMLRVGFDTDGSWRLFGLRPDFSPAVKVQTEDDITASIVVPGDVLDGVDVPDSASRKVVTNAEAFLFQRPDDAVHRGYDGQAERDIVGPGTFLSNFEPLTREDVRKLHQDSIAFSAFTSPMKDLLTSFAHSPEDDGSHPTYVVCSSEPRIVDGAPTKNPRYLQVRPDLSDPLNTAAADLALHLHGGLSLRRPVTHPVDVVAAGRRNNPPESGVPPLSAFNPLHYMELPELFMEFISSMTGKSPSTTGAGSEGALTKAPFNAMPAALDLNAALLSYILCGYDGWISAAGYVGPKVRVDHDISLLVPEVFARMTPEERDAGNLVRGGFLEEMRDTEHDGRPVLASRLGYRMTEKFATSFFGRIFMHPGVVFTPEMLRPEEQDLAVFADSMATMIATHERVARAYFDDGTIEYACPPLRALLEIMANGTTADGHGLGSPEVRDLFDRRTVLESDWYAERLDAFRDAEVARSERAVTELRTFVDEADNEQVVSRMGLVGRLRQMENTVARVRTPGYRSKLVGTLGRQPGLG
ncbi:hypothetical protein [Mobilicoccus caccae]|uniref:PPi-type phosphoenolpyruvate carboxykinase lobe 2 domain-containing protein n=1 Tax=Mobilicoccus caccae TaxID=1859295 RepID=A0ABQ6IWB4_9MICO|nr:hypothetical protein [Mobilicoccus caccae]GMA42235.1 hypothetical protein GCM10025883_42800 [Mobilicoccus caccae]